MAGYHDLLETVRDLDDPEEVLQLTAKHFGASTGTLHLVGGDGLLHLRAGVGTLPEPVREAIRTVPVGKGIAGLTVERAEPVDLCNLQTDSSGTARPGARRTGVQGSICVPVMTGERAIGAFGIGTDEERSFTTDEIDALRAVADRIAELCGSGRDEVDGEGDPLGQ